MLNGCSDTAHIIPSLLIYGCTFASQPWICLSAGHKCAFWKADQLCFCCSNGIFPRKLMCYLFSARGLHDIQHTWEFKKTFKQNKKHYVDDQSPHSSGFFAKTCPFKYQTKLAFFIFQFSFIPTGFFLTSLLHQQLLPHFIILQCIPNYISDKYTLNQNVLNSVAQTCKNINVCWDFCEILY